VTVRSKQLWNTNIAPNVFKDVCVPPAGFTALVRTLTFYNGSTAARTCYVAMYDVTNTGRYQLVYKDIPASTHVVFDSDLVVPAGLKLAVVCTGSGCNTSGHGSMLEGVAP